MTLQGPAFPLLDLLRVIWKHLRVAVKSPSIRSLALECTCFSLIFPSLTWSYQSSVIETTCSPEQCIWSGELLSQVSTKLRCRLGWDHNMPGLGWVLNLCQPQRARIRTPGQHLLVQDGAASLRFLHWLTELRTLNSHEMPSNGVI